MIPTTVVLGNAQSTPSRIDEPTGLAWALWSVAIAMPWLLPTHAEPWTTFYGEWMMAAVLMPVAVWLVASAREPWRIDRLVAGVALVALIPMFQALTGLFVFPGEALLIGAYIVGFALTLAVARRAEEMAPRRLADAMFAGLVIAALLSAGMALYQWLGLDTFGLMVAPALPGGRPVANVGQPNNLSTLLVWGLIGLWWGHSRQRLGGLAALLGAAFLLLGVALTQSRTGWLAVGLLGIVAVAARRVLRTGPQAGPLAALAAWFVFLVLALEPLSQALMREAALSLSGQVATGKRPAIWMMALDAIAQRPWAGYGWNQSVQAHVALASEYPQLQVTIAHAHNLVLDLMLWNGVPLGLLIAGGLGLWFWHQLRGISTPTHLLLLLGVGMFLLHAMLELPHAYAFFLLPAALMMGTASALRPTPALCTVPRVAIGLLVVVQAGLLVLTFDEYGRIEDDLMAYRMRVARIGNRAPPPPPQVRVLQPLQSALERLRTEPRRGMTAGELDQFRRTITRYPSFGGLFRYAQASALNARPDEARWALALICNLNTVVLCQAAARDWQAAAAEGAPELSVELLPTAPATKP